MHGFLFWFVFILVECLAGDTLCETDHIGFEAIAQLHSQIDDDQDGIIDRPESAGVSILSVQCELQFPLINSDSPSPTCTDSFICQASKLIALTLGFVKLQARCVKKIRISTSLEDSSVGRLFICHFSL